MDKNIIKGKEGENVVAELVVDTFLSHWCYLNPKDEMGDKKEICDLLILFKSYCIICEVKNYEYKDEPTRYFAKTFDKGSAQINGAERKLFQIKRKIFISHITDGLVEFHAENYTQIIRLIVHFGEGLPFEHMGRDSSKGFIHFIGRNGLNELFSELTTISDFVDYLTARETFIKTTNPIICGGTEGDLVGLFLTMKDGFCDFFSTQNTEYGPLFDLAGALEMYRSNKSISEDALLHIEALILDWAKSDLLTRAEGRLVAEGLMSLNREERRLFSINLLTFIEKYLGKGWTKIIRRNTILRDMGFIFFYYPSSFSLEQIPPLMLVAAQGFANYLDYQVTQMIVVGINENQKINFLLAKCDYIDSDDVSELKQVLDSLGWFQEEAMEHFMIDMNKPSSSEP